VDVRYWHLVDISVAPHMSAFGGKADIILGKADIKKCPLMTQSGHAKMLAETGELR
jgi:hypothetical protein